MKNSILNIALAFAGVAALSSCSDFLDKAPKEELSDASFWKSSTDAEMYISDMYNSLGWSADEAINTDDATMGIKWAAGNESKGVYDPSDYGWKRSRRSQERRLKASSSMKERISLCLIIWPWMERKREREAKARRSEPQREVSDHAIRTRLLDVESELRIFSMKRLSERSFQLSL